MSYGPYPKFSVGCALLAEKGDVTKGVNIEIASYSWYVPLRNLLGLIKPLGWYHMRKAQGHRESSRAF
jgi:hypothetical protein